MTRVCFPRKENTALVAGIFERTTANKTAAGSIPMRTMSCTMVVMSTTSNNQPVYGTMMSWPPLV